jgi:hypothetical protein
LYKGSDVNTFSTLIFATQFASQIWLEWYKRQCSIQVSDKLKFVDQSSIIFIEDAF